MIMPEIKYEIGENLFLIIKDVDVEPGVKTSQIESGTATMIDYADSKVFIEVVKKQYVKRFNAPKGFADEYAEEIEQAIKRGEV